MLDLDIIGRRIREQRKYFLKISQEKMAEDLNMYQADISNMEKAKSGSGIGDLQKLDLIAEYLNIPLETLIFGREDRNMTRYHGDKMKLKKSKKCMQKTHKDILKRLVGQKSDDDISADIWECGPYILYGILEFQQLIDMEEVVAVLPKVHLYVFFGAECVGSMVYGITDVMSHVHEPSLAILQKMLPDDILDVTDVWRTLNPYWALWYFSEEGPEKESLAKEMFVRMDSLRSSGEKRHILYIESAYVREDCRRNGIFRMMVDYAKITHEGCIMWLNMEPTSGSELENEYLCLPSYSVADLGQLNLNASIAEHVGFTVDPDTCHREAEVLGEDGDVHVDTIEVRKCAYFLPKAIRDVLSADGDLVAKGRALEKLHNANNESEILDVRNGRVGKDYVSEICFSESDGSIQYAIAVAQSEGSMRYLISKSSILNQEKERILEEYSSLEEAKKSERYQQLAAVHGLLMTNINPSDEESRGCFQANISTLLSPDVIIQNFIVDDYEGFLTKDEDDNEGIGLLAKMTRTDTENKGEILYAIVISWGEEEYTYIISRTPIGPNGEIDAVVEIDEDDLEECFYRDTFLQLKDIMKSEVFLSQIR